MKYLITLALLICATANFAQTHKFEQHNGQKIEVNYIKTEDNLLYFSLPNSTEEKTISKFAIAQIHENNKKNSIEVSEKVILQDAADYHKVVALSSKQAAGLQKAGSVSSFLGKTKGDTNQAFKDQSIKRLQQLAAKKGAPFMVITSNSPQNLKADLYTY